MNKQLFVPSGVTYIESKENDTLQLLETGVKLSQNILIEWHKGTGKTTGIYYLAQKHNKPLITIQFTGNTSVDTLIGKWLIKDGSTVWQDWLLSIACRNWFWMVFDEINMAHPDITAVLHSILDDRRILTLEDKDGETIKLHEDCRIFATINPSEEYYGTKEMNQALLDRFGMKIFTYYPTIEKEIEIIKANSIINDSCGENKNGVITRIVRVANSIRTADGNSGSIKNYTLSTRDLISWANLCSELPILQAFNICVSNKTSFNDTDTRSFLEKMAHIEFKHNEKWVE